MSSKASRIFLSGIAMCLCLSTITLGQPKDWDDVSREELGMQVYPSDSSASAVVLFDKAEVDLNNNLEYVMKRHIRIKILSEEGYKWAETAITYNEEFDQEVNRIRGHTFTLDSKGKIKKHKLDKHSIFEEDVSENYKRIKFTLPALKPGAVFEFKYLFNIGSPHLLPDWEFQRTIPVAWSEYTVKIPDWFFYNKMLVGTHPLHINKSEPFNDRMSITLKERTGFYTVKTNYHNLSLQIDGYINKWAMKDVPAVEKLPFMTSVDDYKSKLWIQLTEIRIPRQPPRYFLKSWSDVADEIRDFDSFGGQLKSRSEFKNIVEDLTEGISDPVDKIHSIYRYIIESMVWDGSYNVFADDNIDDVLEAKKGTGAELNLLLIQLLREAGLNANPVLLSTRSHGKIVEYFAIANQFNHVIVSVEVEDEMYLLDATSDDSSIHILPIEDLNGNGLLITREKERWIKLQSKINTKSRIVFNASISNEGKISGDLYVSSKGYYASKEGEELDKDGQDDFMDSILETHFQGGAVDTFEVKNEKLKESKLDYNLSVSQVEMIESQHSGDRLYFNPMSFFREKDNPFSQPERDIPVDFPYLFEKAYAANFVVPEGYSIEGVPETKIIATPGGGAILKRHTQVNQNRISVLSELSIRKKTFKPEEYQNLREFYSHMVELHNQQIVLKSDVASPDTEE